MPLLSLSEIRMVWDLLPHYPDTFVRWFARAGEDKLGGGVDTLDELLLAALSAREMNFYIAPNPASTRAKTRHNAEEVSHWSWFLVDVDPVRDPARPELVAEAVLKKLSEWWEVDFTTYRPLLIHSGRGVQIWIRLCDHPLFSEGFQQKAGMSLPAVGRRQARITNGFWLDRLDAEIGLMHGCRIDTTCKDLPRVMRCPGSSNTKNGKLAILIKPSREMFHLGPKLIAGVPAKLFEVAPIPTLPKGTPWQRVFVHLTLRAQNYLTFGAEEPGRHDTMFHTALCLAERGLERDEIRRALIHGNALWDMQHPGAEQALGEKDVEHALDTAFRRLNRAAPDATLEVGGDCAATPPTEA